VLTKAVGVTSDYATLQEKIAANPQDVAVSITYFDFAVAGADPPSARRFQFRLSDDASAAVGNTLLSSENFPFRVSCGGEELFVGLVYMREGAAALRLPVLHIDTSAAPTVTLLLGAYQGAWYGFGSGTPEPVLTGRIDRPELRARLLRARRARGAGRGSAVGGRVGPLPRARGRVRSEAGQKVGQNLVDKLNVVNYSITVTRGECP
jgi:hypothetical protein